MTCRRLTLEQVGRAGAAYRRGWLPVQAPGLIPRSRPDVDCRPGDRTRPGSGHRRPRARREPPWLRRRLAGFLSACVDRSPRRSAVT